MWSVLPVTATECSSGHGANDFSDGGTVDVARACEREHNRCWTGSHVSSDTLAICAPGAKVSRASLWGFHGSSAWVGDHLVNQRTAQARAAIALANGTLLRCYTQFPALARYLELHNTLKSQQLTWLTGDELIKLGVPACHGMEVR
jgi:hypothetical protein